MAQDGSLRRLHVTAFRIDEAPPAKIMRAIAFPSTIFLLVFILWPLEMTWR